MEIASTDIFIDKIPLNIIGKPKNTGSDCVLVDVESTKNSLRSLALAIATGTPVLLQGPVGCGKTALVEHLANITGRENGKSFIKVQLGDQTDSKLLLGTYCCTEIPGEFVWQPGSLTQAVTNGQWILLEDIDYAPTDVLSILVPILESKTLLLPGHGGTLRAAPGFHLFATQRLSTSGLKFFQLTSSNANITDKLWTKVNIEPLSRSELSEVVKTKWPALSPIVGRILEVYFMFSSGQHESSAETSNYEIEGDSSVGKFLAQEGRLTSTRDLFKWCKRINAHFDLTSTSSNTKLFQDALDCFCCSIAKTNLHLPVAEAIGARFNIAKSKAEFFCKKYKADFVPTKKKINVGRASLVKKQTEKIKIKTNDVQFSFTRPALNLLERISVAVENEEPVLLVGETGTGKTSTVQFLASQTENKLIVINMNQQSDSADFLGGYKPIDFKHLVRPARNEFEDIFCQTFARDENVKFLNHIQVCINQRRWSDLFVLMNHCRNSAMKVLKTKESKHLITQWDDLAKKLQHLQIQMKSSDSALAFAFIEGILVKAIRDGSWLLLDEINLASPETLECLSGLLESNIGSVTLLEKGSVEPIPRDGNFRLFACMNPATDVGKRDLPAGIRNRFTELYVEELEDVNDLRILVSDYLTGLSLQATQINDIVKFYLDVRKLAQTKLLDGTGQKPHYSLRTLCRALSYAAANSCGSIHRSLHEAFCLSFLTQLNSASHDLVHKMVMTQIIGEKNMKSMIKQPLQQPTNGNYVYVEGFWIQQGDLEPKTVENYILTTAVKRNLHNLVRIIAARKHPVLLQGETSVGKTSLIFYVAQLTGNRCVRINNHEHTDLQEYIGSYASDSTGKLVFKEGVLVDAMKKGYWIVLDELNLAPSDVLEALNRVLDDNRELFITETQEKVKAHPQFMLFATQNPPGQYGGRKMLSRAFRNRFIELHFNEIPSKELEIILHERCAVPLSYCRKLVAVTLELQTRRKGSSVFAGKQGFITLRDLFRWGERYKQAKGPSSGFYDWDQHLADEGYILLAGRSRRRDEDEIICRVLQKHLKRTVDPARLFDLDENTSPVTRNILLEILSSKTPGFDHVVWTWNMRRLAVLVAKTLIFKEPVLLVGETGCGKTTICQIFASMADKELFSVNCHMHSEGADFLGGLRPVRHLSESNRLFEWVDGPLVKAMNSGSYFLADEISLAEDSVLERLNSVLENEQSLLLAEKGACDDDVELIVAQNGFHFMATMNPGGDYGKKELSPALRNRFTEVWCPSIQDRSDLMKIIVLNLCIEENVQQFIAEAILSFIDFYSERHIGQRNLVTVRDILSWVNFISVWSSTTFSNPVNIIAALVHGACLVFLDSLGSSLVSVDSSQIASFKEECIEVLLVETKEICKRKVTLKEIGLTSDIVTIISENDRFGIHPFYIKKGVGDSQDLNGIFTLSSPSTYLNTQRLLRALQLNKPILLEGSPGVGKTSLVYALAKATGHELVRINLSEQTDVSDLFGADLPVEGGSRGQFAWRDGPLLKALKLGHWVVFDEMNLASQSVLEGLNACLDHRKEIFIPELGCTFQIGNKHSRDETRIFACQNPLNQGGGRKGLPRSFLNRFTQVFVDPLTKTDLEFITRTMFPKLPENDVIQMVELNQKIYKDVVVERRWGQRGSPWEFNLRDVFRWAEITIANEAELTEYFSLIYVDRLRTSLDKEKMLETFHSIFDENAKQNIPTLFLNESILQIGHSQLPRCPPNGLQTTLNSPSQITELLLLHRQLPAIQSVMTCVQQKWTAILVGPKSSGKTSIVKLLAQLTGNELKTLTLNSATDTMDLLGGFEQNEMCRNLAQTEKELMSIMRKMTRGTDEKLKEMDERFERVFSKGTRISNMDEAIAWQEEINYTKNLLQNIRSTCGSSVYSRELNSIEDKLKSVENQIKKSPNSTPIGGQFEWVDSVLVESVKFGYWLLLDNVNFCSPSVLDRLNALLEPNGCLTINERGVVDGEIPTIYPHCNFRLFLTMDPKNGEISRAMRNRGVEIYVTGEDEEPMSELDTHRLLNTIGLSDLAFQRLLLDVHREIRNQTSLTDKPNCLDLFRAAFLIARQLKFDVDVDVALKHACFDTYVNGQRNKEKKKELVAIINSKVTAVCDKGLNGASSVQLLPSVADFCVDVERAQVENQVAVLRCVCLKMSKSDNCNSDIYIAMMDNPENYLNSTLKLFIQRSSLSDINIRIKLLREILQKSPKSQPNLKIHHFVNNVLNQESFHALLSSFQRRQKEIDNVPLDLRWFSNLSRAIKIENDFKSRQFDSISREINDVCNKFCLWLDLQMSDVRKGEGKMSKKRKRNRSMKGFMDDEKIGNIVINAKNFVPMLIEHFDQICIGDFQCDDDQLEIFEEALMWFERFCNVLCNGDQRRQTMTQFALHWMWLNEKCLTVFMNVQKFSKKLEVVKIELNNELTLSYDPDHERGEFIRRVVGTSAPFKSSKQFEKMKSLIKSNDDLTIWPPRKTIKRNDELRRILTRVTNIDKVIELRNAVIKILNNNFDDDIDFIDLEDDENDETPMNEDGDITNANVSSEISMTIQILPVVEHFYLLHELSILSKLFDDTNSAQLFSLLRQLDDHSTHTTADCVHSASLVVACQTLEENQSLKHELPRMLLNNFKRLEYSPSTYDPSRWLTWREVCSNEESKESDNDLDRSQFRLQGSASVVSAVQSYAAAELFLSEGGGKVWNDENESLSFSSGLKLRSFVEKTRQLTQLSEIWWKNADSLSSSEYNIRLNEFKLLTKNSQRLLSAVIEYTNDTEWANNLSVIDLCGIARKSSEKELNELLDLFQSTFCRLSNDVNIDDHIFVKNLGEALVLIGLIGIKLLSTFGFIDVVERQSTLLSYRKDELAKCRREIEIYDWTYRIECGVSIMSIPSSQRHPKINRMIEKVNKLEIEIEKLEKEVAARPTPPQFDDLAREVKHFTSSIGSVKIVRRIMRDLFDGKSKSGISVVERQMSWKKSVMMFISNIADRYPMYCDLWSLLLIAVYQTVHGLDLLVCVYQRECSGFGLTAPWQTVKSLASFPWLNEDISSPLKLVNDVLIPNSRKGAYRQNNSVTENLFSKLSQFIDNNDINKYCTSILKSCLREIYNSIVTRNEITRDETQVLHLLLKEFVVHWQQQDEERKRKQQEKESLYEYKPVTHCEELPENEQDQKEIKNLFPTYSEEFKDLEENALMDDDEDDGKDGDVVVEDDFNAVLSEETTQMICELHLKIVTNFTRAPWLSGGGCEKLKADYVTAFLARYKVCLELMKKCTNLFDVSLDADLLGGHLVASQVLQENINNETKICHNAKRSYDIYHDSNIPEVVKCRPILENLKTRIFELLAEWPEHPTLNQIVLIIDRILGFSVNSPLMKFITGLEFLLPKAKEWQDNACKAVSIAEHLENITQQIIDWRKMELKCWSGCLDSVASKVELSACKWWFHLYLLIDNYLNSEGDVSLNDFVKTVQELLEKSSLGEFSMRLKIVFGFHCHLVQLETSEKQKELMNSMWNIYKYYAMFEPAVETKIKKLRKPIAKQIRNFIKINRWNDSNFYAVQKAVEKSHQTLHKHMKSFEKILKEPVRLAMTNPAENATNGDEKKEMSIVAQNFLFPLENKEFLSQVSDSFSEYSVLSRLPTLFGKLRKFCKKFIQVSPYVEHVENLEDFTVEIITIAHEFRNLDVTKDATKEKQKSEAKSIHLRKRKALSDLFKALLLLGVSYKKGLIVWKDDNVNSFVNLEPIDIDVSLKNINENTTIDESLTTSWNGCMTYFYRSVARLALLKTAAQEPHKDLGVGNLDRIFGFPSHLLKMAHDCHSRIARFEETLTGLRFILSQISKIDVENAPITSIVPVWKEISELTILAMQSMKQFKILLLSCPNNRSDDPRIRNAVLPFNNSPGFLMTKQDYEWSETLQTTENCLEELKIMRNRLKNSNPTLTTWKSVEDLRQIFDSFSGIIESIGALVHIFGKDGEPNMFSSALYLVIGKAKELIEKHSLSTVKEENEENSLKLKKFADLVESLVNKVLFTIQSVVSENLNDVKQHNENEIEFYLRDLLIKDLGMSVENMQMKNVFELCTDVAKKFESLMHFSTSRETKLKCCRLMNGLHPILSQYCNLAQFLLVEGVSVQRSVCKLNSVLLGIFVELVQKGFCVPEEYQEESSSNDKEGDFKDASGCGLGEGEGVKDVSERLESEDQLEDAHKEGEEEEKKDDDKDIKDEKEGIEMSEDFDAKAQDLEENEEDENKSDDENSEDEEELDKQMGDLGDKDEDAEKLNEKMWGSDSEDNDDDESEEEKDEKDEYGTGAEKTESKLVAKDDNKNKNIDDNDDEIQPLEDKEETEINPYDERQCDDSKKPQSPPRDDETSDETQPLDISDNLRLDGDDDGEDEGKAEIDEIEDEKMDEDEKNDENDKENVGENEEEPMETDINEENESKDGGDEDGEKRDREKEGLEGDDEAEMNENDKKEFTDVPMNDDKAEDLDDEANNASVDVSKKKDGVEKEGGGKEEEDDIESDKQGHGSASADREEGNVGKVKSQPSNVDGDADSSPQNQRKSSNKRRTLGDLNQKSLKRLRTVDKNDENDDKINPDENPRDEKSDLYEHVSKPDKSDVQTKDNATLEQAKDQLTLDDDVDEEKEVTEKDDVEMHSDREDELDENTPKIDETANKTKTKPKKHSKIKEDESKIAGDEAIIDENGDFIETMIIERAPQSTIHTKMEALEISEENLEDVDFDLIRQQLEDQFSDIDKFDQNIDQAVSVWHQFEMITLPLAQELCEQLRLVLEPSLAAKLKGDYRTGKRLNMRKVIPFIASQFRKDKIWLRRTKPSKRQYQIMVAMDDSSSMANNKVKELAFESLAVISKALTLLEAGQLSIASFGESFKLLHSFNEPFNDTSGARTLQKFSFQQQKTKIADMLVNATNAMIMSRNSTFSTETAQLLVIISDGRGIYSEGVDVVKMAIRRARDNHVFVVFVILDLVETKDAIIDIKTPIFKDGQVLEFRSYMDDFPFPFYIILQEIASLPTVLSDALRQWFELVTSNV